jgi:hypothetical protein
MAKASRHTVASAYHALFGPSRPSEPDFIFMGFIGFESAGQHILPSLARKPRPYWICSNRVRQHELRFCL